MEDVIVLEELKEKIQPYLDYELKENGSSLGQCIFNINFCDHFPEDMCESRTDWEDLRSMLSDAHYAVIELVEVIEKILKERQ